MARTSAEELIEQGKAIGEEIGRAAANRETLLRQMKEKFGPLPAGMEARVAAIDDIAQLDTLLDRFVTATSLSDMGL